MNKCNVEPFNQISSIFVPMKKYWNILRTYKSGLIISPFLVLIFVLCETTQPMLMAKVVDEGIMHRDLTSVLHIGLFMLLVSIIGLASNMGNVYISSYTAIGFGTDLRSALFSKIQQLSFSDIDQFGTSSLVTRLTNDITRVQQIVLISMRMLLRSPIMLLMATFFAVTINKELALVILTALPILGVFVFVILKKGFPLFIKVQQKVDSLNGVIRENLINIRIVKSFVREDFEKKKFNTSSEDLCDTVIRASNLMVTIFPLMQIVLNMSIIVILWFGGMKVIGGELKIGELISFVNYLTQILMSLMMLSMLVMMYARATASSRRITEVFDTEPTLENTPEGLTNENKIQNGDITFKDVCFIYPGGKNYVLKDINFGIEAGQTVAIVGATGAAKSTLLQLIPRLYDVTSGTILIDGVDVRNYNLDELHSKISIVLQKNELFSGTIAENIRWGKPDATQDEVDRATKAAQAYDFIQSFPDGYNTRLERGGVNVSGGQKQRICIARAMLRKPKILIMDDSTSAVDTDTESKIRYNLKELLTDTTVLIVTQRVNTMQAADKVIVLDNGRIESIGTPTELLKSSCMYQEIYYSQQLS